MKKFSIKEFSRLNYKWLLLLASSLMLLSSSSGIAYARSQGTDLSRYNGPTTTKAYPTDEFAIAQIGGYNQYGLYDQYTYPTQVSTGIAQAIRMHTYIWYEVGSDLNKAKITMDYFLPKIQTPKGSLVALDYESGASWDKTANTNAILYGMNRIKEAGYTPIYYSYKPYTLQHVDYKRIIQAYPKSLWIAAYKDYQVTPRPDYAYFPSLDDISIWQFTSTYKAGGLDGNVDLLDMTKKGYDGKSTASKTDAPKVNTNSSTSAIKQGQAANNTPKSDIKAGYTVKVNFSASSWSVGGAIPSWVKGKSYKVQEVSGNRVLLAGILSWIDKSNVEILQTAFQAQNPPTTSATKYYRVQYGDNLSSIAAKFGTTWSNLQRLNGLSNPNWIYPGQTLKVTGGSSTASSASYYRVQYGDNLSSIAAKFGTTWSNLQRLNGLSNPNWIYPGQTLKVR